MSYERHSSYYWQDLVLLVESTLFRVPRFVFQDSEVFRDMLSVPQGDGTNIEGSDDAHPLVLSSYLAHEFEQLMKVLLPRSYPPTKPNLTPTEWIFVLKLATTWNFDHVRQTAIKELDTYGATDPILRLIVAKRFNLVCWFVPAVNQLAQREAPLDVKDFERFQEIGSPAAVCKFMLGVGQVRESLNPKDTSSDSLSGCQFNRISYCYTHQNNAVICSGICNGIHQTRNTHNFTESIHRIFECVTEEDGVFVPKSSLWDFA